MSEIEKRVLVLAREGMPATWIAEEFGQSASWVRLITTKHIPVEERRKASKEWSNAWTHIRPKEHMLALHREFAPRAIDR